MLFPVVHPTERLLYRCLSFHKFPSDAALCRNWAKNIRRVESKGVWTINSSTCVCTKQFTAESYHVSGRKRMHKTTRTSNLKIQRYTKSFQLFSPTNANHFQQVESTCQCPRWKLVEGRVLLDVQLGTCSTVVWHIYNQSRNV